MTAQQTIVAFKSGTQNVLPDEVIDQDAASDSLNWSTVNGRVELIYGRRAYGGAGGAGRSYAEHVGYRADGTAVRFRKVDGTIQSNVPSVNETWSDVITGLTANADYVFSNYQSLAGAFVYAFGPDGIYKIATANPTSFTSLYDPAKNFKGYGLIDKARTILWGRAEDPTGLYGSYIDAQNATVYTSVSNESLGASGASTYSGTLAFKASNSKATAFGLQVYAPNGLSTTITAITKQASPFGIQVANRTGINVGDKIIFSGVGGMTEINGLVGTVLSTGTGAGTMGVSGFSTAGFTTYTSGGVITVVQSLTDDFNGNLKSNGSNVGTVNYTTGAYSLTLASTTSAAPVVSYQWENSNNKGVTDFTKSATRLAGEGFVVRQDAGGDAIQVVIPLDGSYFSLKKHSCYRFALDATDLAPVNEIFRTDIGVPSLRSATATGEGIIFMNTSSPSRPRLWILKQNVLGDNFDVKDLFPKYDFSNFMYDDCLVDFWDRYVIVGCAFEAGVNNRLLLCDVANMSVDATYYGIRTSCKYNGTLYGGDSVSKTTYELFTGFDDIGMPLLNYWNSKGETYKSNNLKKLRHFRIKGQISPSQSIQVFLSVDNGSFTQVGTILGSGEYVDYSTSYAIGTTFIGQSVIGGAGITNVYDYFLDIKIKTSKFRKRMVQLVAGGIGYASVNYLNDFDIWVYEERMPAKYRVKSSDTVAVPVSVPVQAIVVGSGGGGSGFTAGVNWGTGGGGGSVATGTFIAAVQAYPVVIGTAGTGGANNSNGAAGGLSSFVGLTANGGLGGTVPATNNGGDGAGGLHTGSAGGAGTPSAISGGSTYYGGGGGGGNDGVGGLGGGATGVTASAVGPAGAAHTGGGGAGGGNNAGSNNGAGGAGGTGVVIVSYPTGSIRATGGTITNAAGSTIHSFTSSGTFTVLSIP